MDAQKLTDTLSVGPQITPADVARLKAQGFRAIVTNRPDGEAADQPAFAEIEAAARDHGLEARHIPVRGGEIGEADVEAFGRALSELPGPVYAHCKTGARSTTLWALSEAAHRPLPEILLTAKAAGHDLSGRVRALAAGGTAPSSDSVHHAVVIVGGGAAGIACAASLRSRKDGLDIAIVEPAETHYYQPGWTMVGAGIFEASETARDMAPLIPKGVARIKARVVAFEPDRNALVLEDGRIVTYDRCVVCPGLKLDWDAVEGLSDTLGRNNVTSNYRYDLAPYTWQLVQQMKGGTALFTQPPMPIKCAGAPQKAMYLSADHWHRNGALEDIDIHFMNAGGVLFGVAAYVPALMEYVRKYDATLDFHHNLTAVDGAAKTATFRVAKPDAEPTERKVAFDYLHVCPPQTAPDFIRASPLANDAGWVDVDHGTLRHTRYDNLWSLGDVCGAPNAKTAAAARKQAPIVAANIAADMDGKPAAARYDGYGSCPLTVERGKIVLAEFGYGGTLLPSFPKWLIDGQKPSRLAWALKARALPRIYWEGMLKGREWMAEPRAALPAE